MGGGPQIAAAQTAVSQLGQRATAHGEQVVLKIQDKPPGSMGGSVTSQGLRRCADPGLWEEPLLPPSFPHYTPEFPLYPNTSLPCSQPAYTGDPQNSGTDMWATEAILLAPLPCC